MLHCILLLYCYCVVVYLCSIAMARGGTAFSIVLYRKSSEATQGRWRTARFGTSLQQPGSRSAARCAPCGKPGSTRPRSHPGAREQSSETTNLFRSCYGAMTPLPAGAMTPLQWSETSASSREGPPISHRGRVRLTGRDHPCSRCRPARQDFQLALPRGQGLRAWSDYAMLAFAERSLRGCTDLVCPGGRVTLHKQFLCTHYSTTLLYYQFILLHITCYYIIVLPLQYYCVTILYYFIIISLCDL